MAECENGNPNLNRLSVEGAERLGDCVSGIACPAITDDDLWKPAYDACWTEARVAVPPTPALRAFCSTFAEALFECDEFFSTSDCENVFGMWSAAVLDQTLACAKKPSCGELDACLSGIFGDP